MNKKLQGNRQFKINIPVFYSSAVTISILGLLFVLHPEHSEELLLFAQHETNKLLGWYYILVIVACLTFVIWLCFSKVGNIPLGKDDDKPEYSYLAWISMLFSGGIGIALLYYGVAEPVDHFLQPPEGSGGTVEAARNAMVYTFLHWGIHGWALYALVGISLGYFAYRLDFPLSLRSALYPIFGKRIYGFIGNCVDGFGILSTVMSLVTNLGIGALILLSGLHFLFPNIKDNYQTLIITVVIMMIVATITSITKIDRGLAVLSKFNVKLLCLLLLFIFFTGPTNLLIDGLVQNTGDYLNQFISKTFDLYIYNKPANNWLSNWTIFYWAWWIAWAPFVGLFIAHISKGRKIKEVAIGVCLLPLIFTLLWLSIFGNAAIDLIFNQGQTALGDLALEDQALSLFKFLEYFPFHPYVSYLFLFVCLILFLSPVSSGTMVISGLSVKGENNSNEDSMVWLKIFWSAVITIVSIGLLLAGSFYAMQSGVVLCGIPFSIILLLYIISLAKTLKKDEIFNKEAQ